MRHDTNGKPAEFDLQPYGGSERMTGALPLSMLYQQVVAPNVIPAKITLRMAKYENGRITPFQSET
jgi:hypothetical protein